VKISIVSFVRNVSSYSTMILQLNIFIDLRNVHYNVPHNVSTVFTGREDVSLQLQHSVFESTNTNTQRRFVVYGMGGSGKTQVLLKFAQDQRERYLHIAAQELPLTFGQDTGEYFESIVVPRKRLNSGSSR
jgi:hypothetical protein